MNQALSNFTNTRGCHQKRFYESKFVAVADFVAIEVCVYVVLSFLIVLHVHL